MPQITTSPDYGTNLLPSTQVISGDGAVTIPTGPIGRSVITKGSALAGTLAAPTSGTDDFKILEIVSTTAAAHVITCASVGFNAKGSSGTATYTAAIGNALRLMAYAGNWYSEDKINVTLA